MHSIPALLVNQPCDLELKGVGIQIRYLAMGVTKLQVGGLSSAKANQTERNIHVLWFNIIYVYMAICGSMCKYIIYIFMYSIYFLGGSYCYSLTPVWPAPHNLVCAWLSQLIWFCFCEAKRNGHLERQCLALAICPEPMTCLTGLTHSSSKLRHIIVNQ